MNIVVILPTYNERENIVSLLEGLRTVIKPLTHHTFTFLVVDDTSPDGTQDVVIDYGKKYSDVVCITGKKEGLGKALLRGMTYAVEILHADVMVQMDADWSHDPKHFPDFIKAIDAGADFVVGSRYIKGGSIPENWGIHRKIYSVIGNAIVRLGLGHLSVHDWTGGYRAYRRKYYELLHVEMKPFNGYLFQIAFLHKSIHRGAIIRETAIHFTDRRFGHSKIATSEYIRDILMYVFQSRVDDIIHGSFGKFLVVGSIGFIINTLLLLIFVRVGLHPALASAIGAECAIISNFILNNRWTFKERKIQKSRQWLKFIQFNGTSLGALGIQSSTVWMGTHFIGIQWYFLYYMMGVGIGLIWNYLMYSKVIWKKN